MQDDSFQDDMTVFKTVQFARLQAIGGSVKSKKRTDLKELPRPYKLPQKALAESVKGGVKISKTCLPLVSWKRVSHLKDTTIGKEVAPIKWRKKALAIRTHSSMVLCRRNM